MRLSTATAYARSTDALSQQQGRLAELQSQMSSGKRVEKPSADPAAAAQAERLRARGARLEAQNRMLDQARSTLQQADSTIGAANEELQSIRELLLGASNDATLNDSDRAAIATQLSGSLSNLLSIANQGNGNGGYVFGGAGAESAPFVLSGQITYQPQAGEQSTAGSVNLPITQDGQRAFMSLSDGAGGTQSIFTVVQAAIDALNDPTQTTAQRQNAINAGIGGLDTSIDRLSSMRTRVGESLRIVDSQNSLNQDSGLNLESRLSDLVDLDYASALTEFTSRQTAVQAAMQTYAQISKMSLFSYL